MAGTAQDPIIMDEPSEESDNDLKDEEIEEEAKEVEGADDEDPDACREMQLADCVTEVDDVFKAVTAYSQAHPEVSQEELAKAFAEGTRDTLYVEGKSRLKPTTSDTPHGSDKRDQNVAIPPVNKPQAFEPRASSLQGEGLFATRSLQPGELILVNIPILRGTWWHELSKQPPLQGLCNQLAVLPQDDRQSIVRMLWRAAPNLAVYDSARLEGLILSADDLVQQPMARMLDLFTFPHRRRRWEGRAYLSETLSLLNHACEPNAEATYDPESCEITVKALIRIEKDVEICIAYINTLAYRTTRHRQLGFACNCSACNKPDPEGQEQYEKEVKKLGQDFSKVMKFRKRFGVREDMVFTGNEGIAKAFMKNEDMCKSMSLALTDLVNSVRPQAFKFAVYDTIAAVTAAAIRGVQQDQQETQRCNALERRLLVIVFLDRYISRHCPQYKESLELAKDLIRSTTNEGAMDQIMNGKGHGMEGMYLELKNEVNG